MKILFATSSINMRGGGIASYANDFYNAYKEKYEFIFVSNDTLDDTNINIYKHYYKINSCDYSVNNVKNLLSIIEKNKPDIIINSNFELLSLAIPYVDKDIIKISVSHFVDGKLAYVSGFNHSYFDSVISLSNAGKEIIKRYYKQIDPNKLEVIYNFFNKKNIIQDNTSDIVNIVYPGGSSLQKNPYLVYKILKKLSKSNLLFNFFWLGNTLLPCSKYFGEHNISDMFDKDYRIHFTGRVPREKSVEIINNADVFLLPSNKEGCPITLLESMSVGTIPIVSDAKHASSEIIINKFNGFVLSNTDPDEYVETIREIILNKEKYTDIKDNCLNTFQQSLSLEVWMNKMNIVLNKKISFKQNELNFKLYFFSIFKLKVASLYFRLLSILLSAKFCILFHSVKYLKLYDR